MNSIDSSRNTGNAILYELVRTIVSINAEVGLKSLATNVLGKFLSCKDPNYKYIALNTLREVVKTDLVSVQKHKNVIIDCLRDSDISIQKRSLDLIYLIVNSSNIKQIIKECLNYLLTAESDFKMELTTKVKKIKFILTYQIAQSLEKYSPSFKWQIDNLVKMLSISGNFVKEEIISSIINVIIANKPLYIYSVHKLYIALKNNYKTQESLVKVAVFIIGELGEFLLKYQITDSDDNNIKVSEMEILELYKNLLVQKFSDSSVKEFILNSIFKLSNKLIVSEQGKENFKNLNDSQKTEFDYEVQQRACEYNIFHIFVKEEIKSKILDSIPLFKSYEEQEVKKYLKII